MTCWSCNWSSIMAALDTIQRTTRLLDKSRFTSTEVCALQILRPPLFCVALKGKKTLCWSWRKRLQLSISPQVTISIFCSSNMSYRHYTWTDVGKVIEFSDLQTALIIQRWVPLVSGASAFKKCPGHCSLLKHYPIWCKLYYNYILFIVST